MGGGRGGGGGGVAGGGGGVEGESGRGELYDIFYFPVKVRRGN